MVEVCGAGAEPAKLCKYVLPTSSASDGVEVQSTQVQVGPPAVSRGDDEGLVGGVWYPLGRANDQLGELCEVGPLETKGGLLEGLSSRYGGIYPTV
tara:strand:- start:55 stop:342 length:288 start_codon:yes stop_codon:yes gene_type:complete